MRSSLFLLAGFIAAVVASPVSNYVSHEKRSSAPSGWRRYGMLPKRQVLPVKIALRQNNLHNIDEYLKDISHPASENYGKHWDSAKIAETFAPAQDSIDAVLEWLASSGISTDRVSQSQSLGWLNFDATIEEAEELLKTQYHLYKHGSGTPHVACTEYHVPEHIQEHIDFITPTVHFDKKVDLTRAKINGHPKAKRTEKVARQAATSTAAIGTPVETGAAGKIGEPFKLGTGPKQGSAISAQEAELADCDEAITLDCLRALYDFPVNDQAAPGNSYGIVEYTPQAYSAADLDLFFSVFAPEEVGTRPILDGIDGGFVQTNFTGFNYNGESDLDLEYAMPLVYPQNVTLYQVGDLTGLESFNTFLDALDASYCSFEGGDDPTQDPQYPVSADGYQGPNQCGGFAAAKVISTSYSYNEADLTPFYEMRQSQEYAKLGLAGTSFLYSSGDNGVAGNSAQCIDPVTKAYNNGSTGIFNPSFPGSCPYITSVGATQIAPNATVTQPEVACETVIYSGGGFSNVFPIPDYQADAVATFFEEHPPPYGADRYNNSQVTRGFPDVAANGANYVIGIQGNFSLVFGTSASSPTFGSILTLINQARLLAGKSSIGFINPVIYQNPDAFNDITSGNNPGCGTDGFAAVEGWDPVTGLGTPNYPKLLEVFLALP